LGSSQRSSPNRADGKIYRSGGTAMGREVFNTELSDPQAPIAEFLAHIPQTTLKMLLLKTQIGKYSETLAKAS
jgi:hypothetical protein